jgi:lysozyme
LVTVPLSDNQFSALVCFAFNVGVGNFESSTLLRLLNRGWYEQVPAQLMRWNRANGEVFGGLSRRRAAEARLWNKSL